MTDEQKWLSRRYLAYKLTSNLWFLAAVWLYFYRIYITDQQVGILDAMAFSIGLLAEVPSGALADKFGRDKIIRLGLVLSGSGILIQAVGSSFIPFFVGQTIMMIGVSFVSGADQALFFDKLKFNSSSTHWRKLMTRGSQAALIGTLLATTVGGWLHTINPRIPWFLTGSSFILSSFFIWGIVDDRPKKLRKKFKAEIKEYIVDVKTGFSEFNSRKLKIYIPLIITVQGLFYANGFGILRPVLLDRFRFSPFWGSVAIATSGLATVIFLSIMHKHADKLSEKYVISTISFISVISLVFSVFNIGYWGYLVVITLYASEYLLHPFMSETLNYHASENQRATVLSVASFFSTLPYVLLAPTIGFLNYRGNLHYFLIIWSILIIISLFYYLKFKNKDSKIKIQV